ncbi:MAG: CoA transferase [Thermoleophilia bacterium]|nr:CoA transferase [Thermoleophilia bacterium]
MSEPGRAQALAGLRVVELGGFAAGPCVGKHLADHGAEVIRIESRHALDGFRTNYPPFKDNEPGPERAALFAMTNDNKLSVTLNLKTPSGVAVARRLIARADVVVENFTPGVIDRLGLDYETLRAANPGLVLLSTCNQGRTGPRSRQPGFGTQLTALSGFVHVTGWPDRDPSLLFGPYIDYIAVGYGACAVLAALDRRRRTGEGCHIDLSQYEAGVQFMAPALLSYFASGRIADRCGNRHPVAAPHGVYPCLGEERWVALSVHDDAEWRRFRAALGEPPWALGQELGRAAERKRREDELDRHITAWTGGLAREEVVARLRAASVHVAPVNDMADLFADPGLAAHGFWQPLDHPELGAHHAEAPPYRLTETPADIHTAAPLTGEHTRRVLVELLGVSEPELARLEAEGALE